MEPVVQKKVPTLVRVIAVIQFIAAVLGVALAFVLVFAYKAPMLGTGLIAFIVIMALLTLLTFIISRALYRGKNWSRVLFIVFGCLGIVSGVWNIIDKNVSVAITISLVINIAITGYLWFNKKVRQAFQ
jgi:hypothetical protein